jgi:phospholipid/cholesterol/gamma-HCH transport system permease protein
MVRPFPTPMESDQPYELLALPGRAVISLLRWLAQLGILFQEISIGLFRGGMRLKLILGQIVTIGFGSQTVVIVTGAFTGAVFAAQMYLKLKDFGIESAVGGIVSISLCRELAPALAGLMVTGRVGASMAAEIGTMKVTEQIDALRVMGVHPVDYLVTPRFIAMLLSLPLLIGECIVFGIAAAAFVMTGLYELPFAWFDQHMKEYTNLNDLWFAMIKGVVFAVLIVLIACHQGLVAENGAVGVGRGTTKAVVFGSLAVLIVNFFLTLFLSYFFPMGSAQSSS